VWLSQKCLLTGVEVRPGRYVPAGSVVKTQEEADRLPKSPKRMSLDTLNSEVVSVNIALAEGYRKMKL